MIKEEREKLYRNVQEKFDSGLTAIEIAKLYDITRQMVYIILEKNKKEKKRA
jgi:DNA invertase Pin-like site-specific DNA recombinase